ncbi:MAG: restriction endonuclease [Dehalococcoidia bacterium]|nr:restriction endonuclease [Dehalococcoidia bacterium]
MLPMLQLLADKNEWTAAACRDALAKQFNLSSEDLVAQIPSGGNLWYSRTHWASTYLAKAGVVERPRRGSLKITNRGLSLLAEQPQLIDTALLAARYEEMRSWRQRTKASTHATGSSAVTDSLTPEELLAESYRQIRDSVEADILERAKSMAPTRFEKLVLDLLERLGYSGITGSAVHLGMSGDGGVDGVIRQDKLGLELIYVQAKRWQNSVGSATVREFAGSLSAHRARKGVIMTTSTFTADARKDAERMGDRIVLVDGAELAALMYDSGLGVSVSSSYELKRPDSDYFEN